MSLKWNKMKVTEFLKDLWDVMDMFFESGTRRKNRDMNKYLNWLLQYPLKDVCWQQSTVRKANNDERRFSGDWVNEYKLVDEEYELNDYNYNNLTYHGWAEFKDSDINDSRYIVKFWSQNKWYAWGSEVTVYYVPSIYKDDYYVIGKWKGGMTRMNMIKFANKIKKCQRKKQQSLSMDKDTEKENWLKSFVEKCW